MSDWIDEALKISQAADLQRASLLMQRRELLANLERVNAALAKLGGLPADEMPREVDRAKGNFGGERSRAPVKHANQQKRGGR